MRRNEKQQQSPERRNRKRFVVLFSLLPLLVGAGILAPGLVKVMAIEDPSGDPLADRTTRRLSRYAHQPLLLPQDFSMGFMPELLDLEHLFSRVDYMADPVGRDRSRLPLFARDFGDVIVLDDVDQKIREIVFKDPVLQTTARSDSLPPPAADLTPLGTGSPIGPGPRFDDYLGPFIDEHNHFDVPEPSTGLLFGLGLSVLGAIRRRRVRGAVLKN